LEKEETKMTNKLIALSQTISQKAMETFNGKLIFRQPVRPSEPQFTIDNLAQKIENLEFQIVSASVQEKQEYSGEFQALKESVKKLEKLYYQLLSTSLVSSAVLGLLFLSLTLNGQTTFSAEKNENLDTSFNPVETQF
jgi:hypothetical protein